MQRNTFIVFLVLALGLGAYVYFYEIKGADERQTAADAEKQLFKVNNDEVTGLSITNSHGTFTLARQATKWALTAPTQAPADRTAVEDLLFAIDAVRFSKVVDEKPSDLTPFGLATPKLKVSFTTKAGDKTLLVGDQAPLGSETYVMRGGDPKLYLTSYPLKEKIDKDLLGWRDKKILDFVVAEVNHISIQGKDFPGLEATKQGDDWVSAAPEYHLDSSQVEALLYDLQGMNALSFTGQKDPSLFGLEPPELTVTIQTGTDKTLRTVMLGTPFGEEGRLPVIREKGEEVRLVDAGLKDKLRKTAQQLRDKKVANVQRLKVDKIEAALEGQTLTATKDKDSWKVEGSLKDKVKPADVEAILDDATGLKADKLIDSAPETDLAKYGLDKPVITLTLHEAGAAKNVKITLAHGTEQNAEQTYARVEGDPTIFELNKYVLDDMKDVLLKTKKASPAGSSAASPGGMPPGMPGGDVPGGMPGGGAPGAMPGGEAPGAMPDAPRP